MKNKKQSVKYNINLGKLKTGKTFRNYKELCLELEIEIKSTNSKIAQLKELARYCDFEIIGHKIIIKEVYKNPKQKIDNRGKTENSRGHNKPKPLRITNPKLANQWNEVKNGKPLPDTIGKNNKEDYWWICFECHFDIYTSPRKRLKLNKGHTDKYITCPYCNASKGSKRIYRFLSGINIVFKTEYIFNDLKGLGNKHLRFDFAIFNNEKLISLIEFDGEFHDKELCPDEEKHKTLSAHDKIKDEYCIKNNIPLLRIHHTERNNIEEILSDYLLALNFSDNIKENIKNNYIKSISDIINEYLEQKELLIHKLSEVDKNIIKYQALLESNQKIN